MRGLLFAATNKLQYGYKKMRCYAERCREAQFLFQGVVDEIEEALKELDGVAAGGSISDSECAPIVLTQSRRSAAHPFEAQFSLRTGDMIIAIVRVEMDVYATCEEGLKPRVRFTIYPNGAQYPLMVQTTPDNFIEEFSTYIAAFL